MLGGSAALHWGPSPQSHNKLSAEPVGKAVRRTVAVGDQLGAVQARPGDKALRIGAGDAHHMAAAHAITDRADAARANRLACRQEVEDRPGIGDNHGV